ARDQGGRVPARHRRPLARRPGRAADALADDRTGGPGGPGLGGRAASGGGGMNDQARGLRALPGRAPGGDAGRGSAGAARALVVGAGKGGAGVSVLSVLLASALAKRGRRVLLLDSTLELGNLHVLLSRPPARTLRALLAGEVAPRELVIAAGERLWLLP